MKKLVLVISLTFLAAAVMPGSVFSQEQKSRTDLLKEISTLSNTKKPEDLEKAYQLSKQFVTRFSTPEDDNLKKVRDFIDRYRRNTFFVATETDKFPEAFQIAKEVLAKTPNDIEVLMTAGYAGYKSFISTKSTANNDEAIDYAKRAIALLNAGGTAPSYSPFKDKPETLAFMHFVVGNLLFDKDLKSAASNIYLATQFESQIKTSPEPFTQIATYYEDEYKKLSTDLNGKIKANSISDAELKTANERIAKCIDLMMDAYARALKRADEKKDPAATGIRARLSQVYEFRKKTTDGLADMIAKADATPMPDPAKF